MRQHGQEQRRRAGHEADAVVGNARQHLVGVKHLLGVDRGALNERRHPAGLVAKRVKKRVDDQVAVALVQPDHPAPGAEGADGGAVCRHHALGAAGGAGGEHQVGGAIGAQGLLTRFDLRGRHQAACVQKIVPGQFVRAVGAGRLATAQHHGVRKRGGALAVQQRGIVLAQKVTNAEQHLGAAALQNVGRFAALHAGVERHQHRAGGMRAAGGQNPLVQVGRPDGHTVPGLHVQRNQRTCYSLAAFQQVGIAQRRVAVHDGQLLRVLLRCLAQQRWQRFGQVGGGCPKGCIGADTAGCVAGRLGWGNLGACGQLGNRAHGVFTPEI